MGIAATAVLLCSNIIISVIKSTVPPGFTVTMKERHPKMRIVFSPEFLTEKNSYSDFENASRVILGGDTEDARVIFKFFEPKMCSRVPETPIAQVDPTVAEMVKLYTNGFLMTKVLFSNEIYKICEKLGVDYKEVAVTSCLDPRIAYSHVMVPGHDGDLGAGGHCFPKDINNLRSIARKLETGERLFTAVIDRNDDLRDDKDWLDMKGRAVVDDYKE